MKFDWPTFGALIGAIVTLIVGLAAVRGAKAIGLKQAGIAERQVDISDRQTAILGRQVELEEQRLAFDLFDRRYKVYKATFSLLDETLQGSPTKFDESTRHVFLVMWEESRFLFPAGVYAQLGVIWAKSNQVIKTNKEIVDRALDHPALYRRLGDALLESTMDLANLKARLPELFPQLILGGPRDLVPIQPVAQPLPEAPPQRP